jgi:type VI secretion system protein VasG
VDHILTRSLLPELSAEFLSRMAADQPIRSVRVAFNSEGKFVYDFS